ncbi:MAG: hypothetical protein H7228_16780 [Polaromonas sp.]|nr:hypothetical protein [Polaromonas sp.]
MIRLASSPNPHPGTAATGDFSDARQTAKFSGMALGKGSTSHDAGLTRPLSSPFVYAPLEGRLSDIAVDDWNELFRAVEARLKATVGITKTATADADPGDIGPRVQRVVLECVAALEKLHTALTHERGMRHQLEMEVFDAQTALAQALAENMSTQAAKAQTRVQQPSDRPLRSGPGVQTGNSVPSSHGFAAMLLAYNATGGVLRGDDLSRLLDQRKTGDSVSLAKLISSREIFSFEWNYNSWVPMFQFEPGELSVRQEQGKVIAALAMVRQGWGLATWFVQPNARLKGRLPIDLMGLDLSAVVDAASAELLDAAP